jgi:transcriptional regulator with XRE-family HTH domain
MLPEEMRNILSMMDWSQRSLARRLGVSEGLVRQWARGFHPVPDYISVWLRHVSGPIQNCPFPVVK